MCKTHSHLSRSVRPAAGRPLARGFTLVELLVVIGIIALLISILLPTLGSARRQAQTTACIAKLQQIMVAANLHRVDHKDYYPVAGFLPDTQPGEALGDPYAVRYSYLSLTSTYPQAPRLVAPITQALAVEMSNKVAILAPTNSNGVLQMFDPTGYSRWFICPAQGTQPNDLLNSGRSLAAWWGLYSAVGPQGQAQYAEPNSYVYNEAVLGFPSGSVYRLAGHASEIRQPASTVFCCDGQAPYGTGSKSGPAYVRLSSWGFDSTQCGDTYLSMQTFYNTTSTPPNGVNINMGHLYLEQTAYAGPPGDLTGSNNSIGVFDVLRHKGRINVAFCDGHVENRSISLHDLQKVFIYAVR
jgi:prepilin-type processing-associated H-X9-DG protein/prepilin-type N-terminal cleavage/methylation domain-containing protein